MRPIVLLAAGSMIALSACETQEPVANEAEVGTTTPADNAMMNDMAGDSTVPASFSFQSGDGTALGSVTAQNSASGLVLRFAGTGMPAGVHGLHFHTTGKCEGPKFESAGSHWNPTMKKHGTQSPDGPHRGDLPNVEVAADGSLSRMLTIPGLTLEELKDADGTALVIHAKADDNKTDPSGDSGDRIACTVIAPAA